MEEHRDREGSGWMAISGDHNRSRSDPRWRIIRLPPSFKVAPLSSCRLCPHPAPSRFDDCRIDFGVLVANLVQPRFLSRGHIGCSSATGREGDDNNKDEDE